jgi:hypothetical protein
MSPRHRDAACSPKLRQGAECRSRAKPNIPVKTIFWVPHWEPVGGQKKPLFTFHPAKISGRAVPGKHLLTIAT